MFKGNDLLCTPAWGSRMHIEIFQRQWWVNEWMNWTDKLAQEKKRTEIASWIYPDFETPG